MLTIAYSVRSKNHNNNNNNTHLLIHPRLYDVVLRILQRATQAKEFHLLRASLCGPCGAFTQLLSLVA